MNEADRRSEAAERWNSTDLQPRTVGGDDYFAHDTDGDILVVRVADDQGMALGALWCGVDGESAGFVPQRSAGDPAMSASILWTQELRRARVHATTSTGAVEYLAGLAGFGTLGHVVTPWAEAERSTLPSLRRAAAS